MGRKIVSEAFVYDAVRTPRGKGKAASKKGPGGALSEISPIRLVTQVIDALASRNGDAAIEAVSHLILGCVTQIGDQGGHVAHVSRLASRLPEGVAAKTLNNYCVSGLSACGEAALRVRAGESGLKLAGGVESMSRAAVFSDKSPYYSDKDVMAELHWAPPVMGAELIATLEGFEKDDLDRNALGSHQKAENAWRKGYFDSQIVPVRNAEGDVVLEKDECFLPDLTIEKLSRLPPAFAEQGALGFDTMMKEACPEIDEVSYLHSVANCPPLADGTACVLIGDKAAGERAGLKPRARIKAFAERTGDPVLQFTAGRASMNHVLEETKMTLNDIDLIECQEVFAAVNVKFLKDFENHADKINVNGGPLSMGHAMGATGAILVTTLMHELERRNLETGLVVGHAANGIGASMIVERV